MQRKEDYQRGQALILIVFAIVGLIGMVGLTVDGGIVFSDRRHAQNAADTAVLAAARAMIRDENWKLVGMGLANGNGYSDTMDTIDTDAAMNNVEVYRCDENADAIAICGIYADEYHIVVKIESTVTTTFGRVVGITQMTNRVHAIAEVVPGHYDETFDGNSVVGLAPETCRAVKYQGNADTVITGGGIYVNSNCDNGAFFNNSGAAELTAPSLCAVGDIVITGDLGIPADEREEDCDPKGFPPDNMTMPDPVCSGAASVNGAVMEPGSWTGDFPPTGVTTLKPGIYCIDNGDFRLNAGDTLWGSSVLLRINNGDIHLNGGASVNLSGINFPDSRLHGLLIFMPLPPNPASACSNHEVIINGSSTSTLTGTILVPCADVSFNGGGDVPAINGQVIGYTVDLSGSSTVRITYNDTDNWNTLEPPEMNLAE